MFESAGPFAESTEAFPLGTRMTLGKRKIRRKSRDAWCSTLLTVEVEFDGSSILSVHVLSHSETVKISDRAIDEIPSQIVEAQTWDVDAVSSATFTSDAIREAVRDCLAQAALR